MRWIRRTPLAVLLLLLSWLPFASSQAHAASPGCSLTLATKDTKAASLSRVTAPLGSAVPWAYYEYVPKGIGGSSSLPLVVSLHGSGSNGSLNSNSTGWSSYSNDQYNAGKTPFIAIFPENQNSVGTWSYFSNDDVDVKVVVAAISDVLATGCVDPSRIYVDGWSAGAYLAQRLACFSAGSGSTPSFTISRIAEYAGGDPTTGGLGLSSVDHSCAPTSHTPLLMMHDDPNGKEDPIVKTSAGYSSFHAWMTAYGCSADSKPDTYDVLHIANCSDGTPLVWVPAPDLNHVKWSCDDSGVKHNDVEWTFFTTGVTPTGNYLFTCP